MVYRNDLANPSMRYVDNGSPRATSDLMASAGSLRRRAVSSHDAGKRSASKGTRFVWSGGKAAEPYRSLPSETASDRPQVVRVAADVAMPPALLFEGMDSQTGT
jgi:hypothetical protein